MFALHQYLVPGCEKLLLLLLVLSPGLTLVSVSYICHLPLVLLYQFIVRLPLAPSVSLGMMYIVGGIQILVEVVVGAAPVCVGSWFFVKL